MTTAKKTYDLYGSSKCMKWSDGDYFIRSIHTSVSTVNEVECLIRGFISGRMDEYNDEAIAWSARFYLTESSDEPRENRKLLAEGDCITVIRKFTELLSRRRAK